MAHLTPVRFHAQDPVGELKWMLEKIGKSETGRMFVGIDPGATGAIAFLPTLPDLNPLVVDIPTLITQTKSSKSKKGVKNKTGFDHASIVKLMDPLIDSAKRVVIALERAQPRPEDTPYTAFVVGCGYAMWHMWAMSFGLRLEEPIPAVWKKGMGLLNQDKDASRAKAMRLFPEACHFIEFASDHNRAEALLLAEYMKRSYGSAK